MAFGHRLRGHHRIRAARGAVAAVVLVAAGTGSTLIGTMVLGAAPAGATAAMYYVAMGDSLGAGIGANPFSSSYVNQIYQHEQALYPGLQLQNFSCPGATTSSVLNGPGCASTTQIAQAAAFLKIHHGHVAFLTVDIGANDVDGCSNGTTIDNTCLANGLAAVSTNLPRILSRLKVAYPGLHAVGMNYYDPFLAAWLTGASGQDLATQSVAQADAFNTILAGLYTAAGFATPDVATAFQTDDFSLTGSYNAQTEPQNVADICNWTHMCDASDIHANNVGHAAIAQAFEPLIDTLAAPDAAPVSVAAVAGNASVELTWSPPPTSDAWFTGYAVTPFLGGVAQPSLAFNTTATTNTIAGLANGQTYTFAVAATNATGTGPQSDPSAPVLVGAPAAPAHASVVSGSTTTATGTIKVAHAVAANHGTPLTGSTATCTSPNGASPQTGTVIGASTAAIAVTGVTTGAAYTCTVTATNGWGTGPASPASNAVIVGTPLASTPPTVTSVSPGALSVAFKAPVNNGAVIVGETATCVSSNGSAPGSQAGTVSPLVVGGLTAGDLYTCTITATNSRGAGLPSKASKAVTA